MTRFQQEGDLPMDMPHSLRGFLVQGTTIQVYLTLSKQLLAASTGIGPCSLKHALNLFHHLSRSILTIGGQMHRRHPWTNKSTCLLQSSACIGVLVAGKLV